MVTRAQTQANYDRLSRWYDLLAGSSERKYCELGLRMLDVRPGRVGRHRVILPIGGVHLGSLAALAFARALSDDVTAVYVSIDPVEAEKIRNKWETWGGGVRLVVLDSPYRLLLEPLLTYVSKIIAVRQPNEIISIVVPQFVPKHWWANALHTQTALTLRMALLFKPGIVIMEVPYQVE